MLSKVVKPQWLVMPLVAIFFLFSTGAAAAPDCHIESAAQTNNQSALNHNHAGLTHDHSYQVASTGVSGAEGVNVLATKALENEMCYVLGFIVLLLFRFLRIKKLTFLEDKISQPRFILPVFLSKHLSHLNLTHLQLGIIRI